MTKYKKFSLIALIIGAFFIMKNTNNKPVTTQTVNSDAVFQKALKFVLRWEGGYVNDPDDAGGATNKGITQSTYDGYRKSIGQATRSVKLITDSEVEKIYYKNYWLKAGCDKMSETFAIISFDTAVNMGVSRVSTFLHFAEYINPIKFIQARIEKYKELATYNNNSKFLKGWLNRVSALETYVGIA